MLTKLIVVGLLVLVLISLFSGLFFIYKDKGDSRRAAKALTIRIALSITIFVILMAGLYFGWIPRTR
jgi:cytochrome bd-type quinol oxidase subunit 2